MTSDQPNYMNYNLNKASVRDAYFTPPDRIWGDVIRHERVLERIWNETWENTIVPYELRPEKYIKPKAIGTFYRPKPSPSVPLKYSDFIGWRSSDPNNSLDYFNVKYVSDRKRFSKEQFGYYRALKYISESEKMQKDEKIETPSRDEKHIKHTIKRLVC